MCCLQTLVICVRLSRVAIALWHILECQNTVGENLYVPVRKFWDCTSFRPRQIYSKSFLNLSSINQPSIRCHTIWPTDRPLKWTWKIKICILSKWGSKLSTTQSTWRNQNVVFLVIKIYNHERLKDIHLDVRLQTCVTLNKTRIGRKTS